MPPEYGTSGTHPGDLITAELTSLAPDALFTRLLDNADAIGLSDEKVRAFHRLAASYRERLMAIRLEFTALGHQVRLTPQPLGDDGLQRRGERAFAPPWSSRLPACTVKIEMAEPACANCST